MPTKIAWTDESWNPVTGCTPVSEGCAHCYGAKIAKRFGWDFSKVTLHPDRLEIPLHWQKPRMVFLCSMGDLFHKAVPFGFIDRVWETMRKATDHQCQVLTKRPQRMQEYLRDWAPLPNVWLGVSAENQRMADERIPLLLETPAAKRFVSCEPLLGPINLGAWLEKKSGIDLAQAPDEDEGRRVINLAGLALFDWVIVGGESGGPSERRLVERCKSAISHIGHDACVVCSGTGFGAKPGWAPKPEALEWVRSLRDQCQAAGVPFFFKQWGPKAGQGTLLDGREWRETPQQEVRA